MNANISAQNVDFEDIADAIQEERCLIFLGPDITINYFNLDEETNFFKSLSINNSHNIRAYCEDEGLLIFTGSEKNPEETRAVKKFYEAISKKNAQSNSALLKIAQIPFHCIVSATPDTSMPLIFKSQNLAYEHTYCTQIPAEPDKFFPKINCPLLYNILGCTEDHQKVILTHNDLFDFLHALYTKNIIVDALMDMLDMTKRENKKVKHVDFVLFLGFDFSKWYYQLLLHLLKTHKRSSYTNRLQRDLSSTYKGHFNVKMINHDINDFVDGLHAEFVKRGTLRRPVQPSNPSDAMGGAAVKPLMPDGGKIKDLLFAAFAYGEFDAFCGRYYATIHKDIFGSPAYPTLKSLINVFYTYIERDGNQAVEQLLELLRAKNPVKYGEYAPYFS